MVIPRISATMNTMTTPAPPTQQGPVSTNVAGTVGPAMPPVSAAGVTPMISPQTLASSHIAGTSAPAPLVSAGAATFVFGLQGLTQNTTPATLHVNAGTVATPLPMSVPSASTATAPKKETTPTKTVAKVLGQVYSTYQFLVMTCYFRDISGCLANLCGKFQTRCIQLDEICPAVDLAIATISAWYPDDGSQADPSPRVKQMENDLLEHNKYSGFTVKYGDSGKDAAKVAARKMMFAHASAVVAALNARFPQKTLAHAFRIFYPTSYQSADTMFSNRTLNDFGSQQLTELCKHFGTKKTVKSADGGVREFDAIVDSQKCIDEFSRFKSYMHLNRLNHLVPKVDSGKKKKGTAVADATTAHAGAAAHTVAGETALEAVETEVIHFKEFFKRQFSYLKKEFPTLVMLMQISLVIPMTSVDPERGFSCMNRIKTKSRNKLSNLVLDHLMRISLSAYNLREFMMRFGTIVVRKFLGMRNCKFE